MLIQQVPHRTKTSTQRFYSFFLADVGAMEDRSIRLVSKGGRLMHITSNLPKQYQAFAMRHADYILNRVPAKAN